MKDPEKSRADSATCSRESYMKDPEKNCTDSAACSRESYMKDPEKSAADSTTRSWESYMKDPEKNTANSTAWSKTNYDKDIKASRTHKRQRYVMLCVHLLNYLYFYQGRGIGRGVRRVRTNPPFKLGF